MNALRGGRVYLHGSGHNQPFQARAHTHTDGETKERLWVDSCSVYVCMQVYMCTDNAQLDRHRDRQVEGRIQTNTDTVVWRYKDI
jgi:hypothetical protein